MDWSKFDSILMNQNAYELICYWPVLDRNILFYSVLLRFTNYIDKKKRKISTEFHWMMLMKSVFYFNNLPPNLQMVNIQNVEANFIQFPLILFIMLYMYFHYFLSWSFIDNTFFFLSALVWFSFERQRWRRWIYNKNHFRFNVKWIQITKKKQNLVLTVNIQINDFTFTNVYHYHSYFSLCACVAAWIECVFYV